MLKTLFMWYFAIVNIVGLIMMGSDKNRAVSNQWRISEKALWITALIGAAPGMTVGMKMFRHKTKHMQFKLGFPILAILDIIIYLVFLDRLS